MSYKIESETRTSDYDDGRRQWDDVRSIREKFGIRRWDPERFDWQSVLPNLLHHAWEGPPNGKTADKGGTDFLCTGKPGKGKSTLALYFAVRLMEINDEAVVWRGSTSRSEWLPLAPWATLCIPEGVDVSARLEPKHNPNEETVSVELDDLVREVKRYANPVQLNRQILEPGQFHVVYPDPRMRDCQRYYEESDEKQVDGVEFSPDDPLGHWWFAWILARIEYGPHGWTTLILDEIGDLAPESAANDEYGTLPKIKLLKNAFVDARKYGLSLFCFGHSEIDIHNQVRHKIRWRIQMPGQANPTSGSDLVGFRNVKMDVDLTSDMDVGEALAYTESNFQPFQFDEMPAPIDRILKVDLEVRE